MTDAEAENRNAAALLEELPAWIQEWETLVRLVGEISDHRTGRPLWNEFLGAAAGTGYVTDEPDHRSKFRATGCLVQACHLVDMVMSLEWNQTGWSDWANEIAARDVGFSEEELADTPPVFEWAALEGFPDALLGLQAFDTWLQDRSGFRVMVFGADEDTYVSFIAAPETAAAITAAAVAVGLAADLRPANELHKASATVKVEPVEEPEPERPSLPYRHFPSVQVTAPEVAIAIGRLAARHGDQSPDFAASLIFPHVTSFPYSRESPTALSSLGAADPARAMQLIEYAIGPFGAAHADALHVAAVAIAETDPDQALQIAEQIPHAYPLARAYSLAAVARSLGTTDPGRAREVALRAAQLAEQTPDGTHNEPAQVLTEIARAIVGIDPNQAVRIISKISDETGQGRALMKIAEFVVDDHPEVARQIADYIPIEGMKSRVSEKVAYRLVATDIDRALQIIDGLPDADPKTRPRALNRVVERLCPIDLERALQLAEGIADQKLRASALSSVVQTMCATDPDRALQLAEQINDDEAHSKSTALNAVVEIVESTDVDQALQIARQMPHDRERGNTLQRIAHLTAANDPERAIQIVAEIPDDSGLGMPFVYLANSVGVTDEDLALRILDHRPEGTDTQFTLMTIATSVGATDPDRALRLADQIAAMDTNEVSKSWALAEIAESICASEPDGAITVARSTIQPDKTMIRMAMIATLRGKDPKPFLDEITDRDWMPKAELAVMICSEATPVGDDGDLDEEPFLKLVPAQEPLRNYE